MMQRIITASILLLIVLAIIYSAPPLWFNVAAAVVVLLMAYEWIGLSRPVPSGLAKLSYLLLTLLCLVLTQWLGWGRPILYVSALIWVAALLAVLIYARRGYWLLSHPLAHWLAGCLFTTALYVALVTLHTSSLGANWLVLAMASVWIMDSGAYVVGRKWGRHTLARRVSPGKTWEGLLGGILMLAVYLIILYMTYSPAREQPWLLGGLFVAGLWSVVGDLFESVAKRAAGVKDSGVLLPGHGGVLDRLDGLVPALPWLALCTLWLGY